MVLLTAGPALPNTSSGPPQGACHQQDDLGALEARLSQSYKSFFYLLCSCSPGPPPGARVLGEGVCGGPSSEGTQQAGGRILCGRQVVSPVGGQDWAWAWGETPISRAVGAQDSARLWVPDAAGTRSLEGPPLPPRRPVPTPPQEGPLTGDLSLGALYLPFSVPYGTPGQAQGS